MRRQQMETLREERKSELTIKLRITINNLKQTREGKREHKDKHSHLKKVQGNMNIMRKKGLGVNPYQMDVVP